MFGWSWLFMIMSWYHLEEFDYVWMVQSFHDPHFAEQFLKAARIQLDNKSCLIVISKICFSLDILIFLRYTCVLSMILMATSLPVGMCLASFTLAKLPFPIVFSSRYFPMCGSSPVRRPLTRELGSPWQIFNFSIHKNLKFHFGKYISNFRCSPFGVLTSEDMGALLELTNIKLILWNSIFALLQSKFVLKILLERIFTCVNLFHNRQASDKVQKFNLGNAEGRKWLPSQYTLSPLLQECATIKCDHQGIWQGGAGSLCIAPGAGKSGVRQEDPPFQYWCTAMHCGTLELHYGSQKYLSDLWHVKQYALFRRYQNSAEYSQAPWGLGVKWWKTVQTEVRGKKCDKSRNRVGTGKED